ncbi:hypothetical protein SAMN05216296_1033 [Pseudomonas pohangensis]|uniref:Uncharacterized protein n=1 Tax=Pseudomonas pohangensis TaxID=364197 RepID=A0A1H2ESG6_9PSED|nr:hypothetical protein [Pseudomonas pohangensis]SDT97969.1 hypothetical protein SAMN05216296_1033 [Pseudomonas pohangensis]
MNERELKLLLEAGAIKAVLLIAQGAAFHLEIKTAGALKVLMTGRGEVRLWRSLDSCVKWLRKAGIGQATIQIDQWQPDQKPLELNRSRKNAY